VPLNALEPGPYVLRVEVSSSPSGPAVSRDVPLEVKRAR
jgi:hypothetical protein